MRKDNILKSKSKNKNNNENQIKKMGCLPERAKNNPIIEGFSGEFPSDNSLDEKNKNGWYIEGMLVKERKDDPKDLYIKMKNRC